MGVFVYIGVLCHPPPRPCVTRAIVSRLVRLVYPPGDAVFQEGDIANEMFFIASGTVTIQYRGEHVSTLTTGGFFGEFALLEVGDVVQLSSEQTAPHLCDWWLTCYAHTFAMRTLCTIMPTSLRAHSTSRQCAVQPAQH